MNIKFYCCIVYQQLIRKKKMATNNYCNIIFYAVQSFKFICLIIKKRYANIRLLNCEYL